MGSYECDGCSECLSAFEQWCREQDDTARRRAERMRRIGKGPSTVHLGYTADLRLAGWILSSGQTSWDATGMQRMMDAFSVSMLADLRLQLNQPMVLLNALSTKSVEKEPEPRDFCWDDSGKA